MRVRKVNNPSEPDVHGFVLPPFFERTPAGAGRCGDGVYRRWTSYSCQDDRRGKEVACGVSAPHAEVLLFRQKDPKPWAPGRGPPGAFAPVPKA